MVRERSAYGIGMREAHFVPAGGTRSGLVGADEKSGERLSRIGGAAHRLVGKGREVTAPRWAPARALGFERLRTERCGFRCGVAVVRRRGNVRIAGPEAERD